MAFSPFILIAFILFATTNPLSYGQNITLGGINVSGRLCCTSAGNCPGQGVSGADVSLNCSRLGGGSVVVGQNTTDANGGFTINNNNIVGAILGRTLIPCVATVQLPLSQTDCPVLSTANGTLSGLVQPVGMLLAQAVGGIVTVFSNVGT